MSPKETNPQPAAPVAEQPAPAAPQPQTITAPEGQQVQYVVAKKSLEGLGGWLAFWLVIFGLAGIGYINAGLSSSGDTASLGGSALPVPLSLLLGVAFFASAVLIAVRKKVAIWASIATIIASALISTIMAATSDVAGANPGTVFVMNTLLAVLLSLYFLKSERVKLTLTK